MREFMSTCSRTDVALCSKGWRLASNAEIQQAMKQRRDDCLLSDAIDRYHSAVQLTSPTASTCKSRVVVSVQFSLISVFFNRQSEFELQVVATKHAFCIDTTYGQMLFV